MPDAIRGVMQNGATDEAKQHQLLQMAIANTNNLMNTLQKLNRNHSQFFYYCQESVESLRLIDMCMEQYCNLEHMFT